MPRDRIAEINAVRARKGEFGARHRAELAIRDCLAAVSNQALPENTEFFPIRLVTALEVVTRECVAELIDAGEPYTARARGLIKEIKFDFDLTQALIGKKLTFGELASHIIPFNSAGDIEIAFSQLTGKSLRELLANVYDRWAAEVEGASKIPIIADVDHVKRVFARLFEVRHVLVHEMPSQPAFDNAELQTFAAAAADFAQAIDQVVSTLVHGEYPQTQADMNEHARVEAEKEDEELTKLISSISPRGENDRMRKAHAAWESYRECEATFVSRIDRPLPGSIAPLLYWSAWEEITRERIAWIKRQTGEGGAY